MACYCFRLFYVAGRATALWTHKNKMDALAYTPNNTPIFKMKKRCRTWRNAQHRNKGTNTYIIRRARIERVAMCLASSYNCVLLVNYAGIDCLICSSLINSRVSIRCSLPVFFDDKECFLISLRMYEG